MPDLASGAIVGRFIGCCDWGRLVALEEIPDVGERCPAGPEHFVVIHGPVGIRIVQLCTPHVDRLKANAVPAAAPVEVAGV